MNSTTSNSTCAEFLFTSISVEQNPQQVGNICPETIVTYLISSLILASTLFLFTSSLIMIIIYGWRNYRSKVERMAHIKARNPIIMLINLFTSAGIAAFHTLRYLIGRKIFPCSLLSLSYFLIPPVIFLPTLLRSSRAFNMARINFLITNTRKRKTISIDQRSGKNIMMELAMSNSIPNPTSEDELASYSSIVDTFSSNKPTTSNNNTTITMESSQPSTPRKVDFKIDNINSINEQSESMSDTESDVGSLYDVETTISKSTINQLKVLNILVSNKFIFILYCSVLACHVLLWLILGGIEEGIYQSNPSKSRIFAGFLYFTSGCIVNINAVIVVICQAVLYLAAEIILLILCSLAERDTYYIKLETFVIVGLQIVVTAIFGMSYIGAINRYTEYFYPGGNIVATFAMMELFVSNFLPLVLSFYHDRRMVNRRSARSLSVGVVVGSDDGKQQALAIDEVNPNNNNNIGTSVGGVYESSSHATSGIIMLLKHKKYGDQFLNFAQRSYCPENILCWRDIEAYKKVKKDASRRRIGQFIMATYLLNHSPLELNISKDDKHIQQVEQALTNKSLPLSVDLFDFLQLLCLINMTDIYERIKSSNKEIREHLKVAIKQ